MASSLERFTSLSTAARYGIVMGSSFLLWIVPVNIRAPKLVTFAGFAASIAGFGYCFQIAGSIDREGKAAKRLNTLSESLTEYQFALEEEANKQELWNLFFPPQPQQLAQANQQPIGEKAEPEAAAAEPATEVQNPS